MILKSFYLFNLFAVVYCSDKLQTKQPNLKIQTTVEPFHLTTVPTTTTTNDVYVLKYPQQACIWSDYEYGTDWTMVILGSKDASQCASVCTNTENCTGFEVGSDSGSSYGHQNYCSLWLNNACKVPDHSYLSTTIQVDTYTISDPLDTFEKYSNLACLSLTLLKYSDYTPTDCAIKCLDYYDCNTFEMNQNTCTLWTGEQCTVDNLIEFSGRDTYFLIDDTYSSFYLYVFLLLISVFLFCIGVCCCRSAMLNRLRSRTTTVTNMVESKQKSRISSTPVTNMVESKQKSRISSTPIKTSPVWTATLANPQTEPVKANVVYTATIANDISYPQITNADVKVV